MSSPYADLGRPPLSARALRAALAPDWDLRVVAETGSTNADVVAAARAGAAEGYVVVAEAQAAGRGRLGRNWVAPARSGLTFSVLLRPAVVPAAEWGWLPLLAGVALAEAVQARTELAVRLKWPNDLLAPGGGKLAGILAEVAGGAVVLGFGLNVSTTRAELAELPGASSLALESVPNPDRDPLLRSILRGLGTAYQGWLNGGAGPVPAFRGWCETIGRAVRVELPGGGVVQGTATGVDPAGRLLVRAADGTERAWAAADVEHLR